MRHIDAQLPTTQLPTTQLPIVPISGRRPPEDGPVVVDCDSCVVRSAAACGDCVVTVLLGSPPQGVELHSDEQAALDALADSGLVPPLRLVTPHADAG